MEEYTYFSIRFKLLDRPTNMALMDRPNKHYICSYNKDKPFHNNAGGKGIILLLPI